MGEIKKMYNVEELRDLNVIKEQNPISFKVRERMVEFMGDDIILKNGRKVFLKYPVKTRTEINESLIRILTEFIANENRLNECIRIKDDYIMHKDNVNNTNSYIRNIFDIIVGMDRVNKYIWNIVKILLEEDVSNYATYTEWRKKTIKFKEEIYSRWNLIYNIRNKIEHPEKIITTQFRRVENGIIFPEILYDGQYYDLLMLGNEALGLVSLFFDVVLEASIYYSKYVIALTDEKQTGLYVPDKKW